MPHRDLPATRREYDPLMLDIQRRFNDLVRGFFEPEPWRWTSLVRWQDITVDVREHGDEVTVVADLPGVDKQDLHVELLEPKILQIRADQREEREEKKEEYYLNERSFRRRSRTVLLPADVTEEGVETSFKNVVLELRFRKTPEARRREIPIG